MWSSDCGGTVIEFGLEKDEVLRNFGKIEALAGLQAMCCSKDGIWLFFGVSNKILQMNVETMKIVNSYSGGPSGANITCIKMGGVLMSEDEKKAMTDKVLRNKIFEVEDECDDNEVSQPGKHNTPGFLAMVMTGASKGLNALGSSPRNSGSGLGRTPPGSFAGYNTPLH